MKRKPRNVTLPDADYAFLKRFGGNNVSRGISRAVSFIRPYAKSISDAAVKEAK